MTAIVFGAFGLIIGSFLNVLILRHGEGGLGGRSACMSCARTLKWYDMVPVLSWALLRGRCRMCAAPISWQYPILEALTGILFAVFGSTPLPLLQQLLSCAIVALLIAIAVYDLQTTIIPDLWSYLFSLLALVMLFAFSPHGAQTIFAFVGGPIAALPLFVLWLVSKGRWMGFGDVKLALGIGWLLGAAFGVFVIFFAFVIGACISVPLLVLSSERGRAVIRGFTPTVISQRLGWGFTMGSEIPFGPFLVTSTLIVWLSLIHGFDPIVFLGLSPW